MSGRRPGPHALLRLLLLGLCAYFAWHGVHAGLRERGSDFSVYYDAGRAVLAGRDPTLVERYLYLPAFAVALAPLAALPYTAALVLWQLASLVALAWVTARCQRRCERALGGARPYLAWAPLACVLRLVDSSLANGQANLLVLALIVAALEAWFERRERRAGLLLGCASALKIVPLFLAVAFLARRGVRAFTVGVASTLLLVLPLSALVLGWRTNAEGLARWYQQEVRPYQRGGDELLAARAYLPGQSLTAVTYRLLCDTPATSVGAAGPRANLVALDPQRVKWIVRALSAATLLALAGALALSARSAAPAARLREAALVLCAALALAPLVHKAHMVWLVLPYAVLLGCAPPLVPVLRRARWGLVGLSVLAIGATTPTLLGRELATWALSYDAVFFGLACVGAALLADVWGTRRDGAPLTDSAS
ncbi:MAG: DUF2029 domain-containing protein [Planctomycetes bacterium]|nr:DUF2029 domain-containing protein [Planctomycetota bacterium]